MLDIATANKAELRAAMRASNLPAEGLNPEGMRAALLAHQATLVVELEPTSEPALEQAPETIPTPVIDALIAQAPSMEPAPVQAPAPVVLPTIPAPVARPARLEAHGVKQPGEGTICRQIWNYCEGCLEGGYMPRAKDLRAWGAGRLDDTTMTIQFYRWRKFKGISGRQA